MQEKQKRVADALPEAGGTEFVDRAQYANITESPTAQMSLQSPK
jgi:hypothetical protein